MHAAGVEQAPSSQPGRIVEINGVDDERIPLPGSCALSVERCEVLRRPVPRATIRGEGAVFVVSATVIGIYRIEENEVSIGLDDPRRRAVPREPQRLSRYCRLAIVCALVE